MSVRIQLSGSGVSQQSRMTSSTTPLAHRSFLDPSHLIPIHIHIRSLYIPLYRCYQVTMKQRFSSLDVKVSSAHPQSYLLPQTNIPLSPDHRPRALHLPRFPPPRQRLRPLLPHLPPQIRQTRAPRAARHRLRFPRAPLGFRAHNRRRALAFHRAAPQVSPNA
jgi:hypothetical protein